MSLPDVFQRYTPVGRDVRKTFHVSGIPLVVTLTDAIKAIGMLQDRVGMMERSMAEVFQLIQQNTAEHVRGLQACQKAINDLIGTLSVRVVGTSDATPGVASSHAHGLSSAPSVNDIVAIPRGADNGNNDAGSVAVLSADATNVTIKATVANLPFTLLIISQ